MMLRSDTEKLPAPLARLAEGAMRALIARYPWPGDESDLNTLVYETIETVIPRGRTLWRLFASHPDLGISIGGPGAVADTIEDVVVDAVIEAMERPVYDWVDAVEAAEKLLPIARQEGDDGE